jgi:hypothetical protein
MADKKVSQLPSATQAAAPDLLMIVTDPNGTPTSKKITTKALFGRVPANTVFAANVTTTGNMTHFASNVMVTKTTTVNTFAITFGATPYSNNATTVGMAVGEMRFTNNYIYIAVNATTIKRAALFKF